MSNTFVDDLMSWLDGTENLLIKTLITTWTFHLQNNASFGITDAFFFQTEKKLHTHPTSVWKGEFMNSISLFIKERYYNKAL